MFKISTRLTLWYIFATAIIISAMAITMYYIYEDQRRSAINTDLIEYADFLTNGLGPESEDMDAIYVQLLNNKDKPQKKMKAHRFVLASSDSIIYENNAIKNLDSLLNGLIEKDEFSFKSPFNTIKIEDIEYQTYTRNFKISKTKDYQLIVFTSLDRLYESLIQLRTLLMGILPISIFAAGIVGYIIARRAMAPVRYLTRAASRISSANLESRVPIGKSNDELSLLAKTFNEMINRLEIGFKSHKRFIADASHDFRTPLTVIQIELELLLNNKNLTNETIESINKSLKEVERLNKLADDLLLLAKADANNLEPIKKAFRLDELILECVVQLSQLAQKSNISISPKFDEAIEINADESLIRRALINGLDNAIKFSDSGKIVVIAFKTIKNKVEIEIINFDEKLDVEFLPSAFDRFKKSDTSRVDKGFGLGLSIIQAIVVAHSGKVELISDKMNQVILKINLPI